MKRRNLQREDIEKKKARLESDISTVVKDADDLARQAEVKCDMSLLVKSNALRKAADDKKETLNAYKKQISDFKKILN